MKGQLQIGLPRPSDLRWFRARRSDGTFTKLGMVDFGELLSGVDNQNDVYATYTSYFETDSRYCFSAVDKALCDRASDSSLFRMNEDFAVIETLGIDPDTVEFT